MSARISIVRDSIIRIVRMLTEKKVQVTQRGSSAYVTYNTDGTPKVVNIPHIPEDATEDLLIATQGFLDHEVAHVLFTDYAAVKKANEEGYASLHNIIEDSFIERKMAVQFAGSAFNLSEMGQYFLKNYTDKRLSTLKPGDPTIEGLLIVPAIRAWAGQKVFNDYMNDGDKWSMIAKIVTRLTPLIPRVAAVANSMDAANLARDMKKLLELPDEAIKSASEGSSGSGRSSGKKEERRPGERPKRKPRSERTPSEELEPGSGSGGDPGDDDDVGSGSGRGEGSGAGPSVEEKDEPGAAVGGPEDEDESESDDDGLTPVSELDDDEEDDEFDPDADEEDAVEASGEGGGGGSPSSGGMETARGSGDADLYKGIERELAKDFDEELAKMITKSAADDIGSKPYKVYSTDFDVIEPMKVGAKFKDEYLKTMQEAVDHMVGPLQKDFERAIAAKSATTWSAGHRSGRMHSAALSRLSTGDDRIFRRRHINNGKDVAVSLLIDCSGSMGGGGKITAATYAAYALASVLDRMNIACEVLGFTTRNTMPREMFAEESTLGIRYSRAEALYMPIFKSFSERLNTETKKRFAMLPYAGILRENVDGECVQVMARRLAARKEQRKVMFVFSDGSPACSGDYAAIDKHLYTSVKEVERSGIEVMGIGIADNSAAKYYKKHVLLTNISDLPTTVIGQIKKILMQ